MTNTTNLVKKAFSVAVAATTILWSVGLSAFLPTAASAASFGDLIKGTSLSTVYYYGSDGQRYAFPNEKTYFSWYKDFASVKMISDSELASITLAGNIKYRPGARWIKITSDNKVYVTTPAGKVRWVENEATAKGLGGDNWNAHIDDVPDVFFTDYTVGDSLTSAASGYDGMLWSDATGTYRVSGATYQKVTDAGLSANGFNAGFVLKGTGFTKSGLTAGAEVSVAMSNLTDAAQKVTTATYAVSQNVSVSLASTSPAASTFLALQGLAHMASLNFTNPTSSAVTVRGLTLKRTGVSADTTLANSYLFDGWIRSSDSAAVSSGLIKWNDAGGLFTIPAGGSKVISVRSDLASASGETVGVQLVSAADVVFTGAFAAAGTFPIQSATHTLASAPSGFTSVTFGSATPLTSATTTLDAQNDYAVWTDTVTVANNEALLYAMRFRNIGSINASDIQNWRLYIAGVQKGSAVLKQDANGYISFDFSAAPVRIKTGAHVFKLMVDVIGGTSRTITVGLRNSADAVFVDEDYVQPDLAGAGSFAGYDSDEQTVNTGTLTIAKTTDSPSSTVTIGASNAVLGKWTLKSSGESMKVETMRFSFSDGNDTALDTLLNGAVYANGTQIGSTTTLQEDSNSTAYTEYSFGSSLIVYPGTPVTVELRADIDETSGSDDVSDGDTITANVAPGASTNVLRMSTGTYTQVPASAVTANQVEVDQGTVTAARNTSYASQTVTDTKVAYKIGSYTITSTTAESVNINSFVVDLDASSGVAAAEVPNMYIMYGKTGSMTTSTVKATPSIANAGNTWSVNTTLAPNSTIYVDVYADLDSAMIATDVVTTTMLSTGTTVDSGVTADASVVTGQSITIAAGTFVSSLDGSTPVAFVTAGNKEVTAAKYRFTATNESYTIKEIQLSLAGGAALTGAASGGAAAEARIYDGSTLLGSAVFATISGSDTGTQANGSALITGLSIPVASNSYKALTAKLVMNQVGSGAATSQVNAALTLDVVKAYDSQGALYTTAAGYTDDRDGNAIRVYKSVPTFNQVDLTNSTIINAQAMDLYKFTVTADANGAVALKQVKFNVSFSDGGTADSIYIDTMKLYKNGVDISTGVTTVLLQDEHGNSVESAATTTSPTTVAASSLNELGTADTQLVATWLTEDVISAGETVTYTVRGTPRNFRQTGADTVGDTVSLYIPTDSAGTTDGTTGNQTLTFHNAGTAIAGISKLFSSATASATATNANIIWSDNALTSHNATVGSSTGDWANGYLVLNLDLGSETWTK